MGLGALLMPNLLLVSTKTTSTYKKQEVIKYTKKFITNYYNKFSLQEHQEVFPSVPLEIKYIQQKI